VTTEVDGEAAGSRAPLDVDAAVGAGRAGGEVLGCGEAPVADAELRAADADDGTVGRAGHAGA